MYTKEIEQQPDPLGHFIPKWSNQIIQANNEFGDGHNGEKMSWIVNNTDGKLDYGDNNSCLVGEAHYFKKVEYQTEMGESSSCRECNSLCGSPASNALDSKKNLKRFKQKLYNHLRDKHPKLFAKWEKRRGK